MTQRIVPIFLLLAITALLLVGCSDSNNLASGNTGRAVLTINWPVRSRLIPVASNSISITITKVGGFSTTQIVSRPTNLTSTVVFNELPTGTLSVTATAYPLANATGTAQATGTAPLLITARQTVTLNLTMNSTITAVMVTPSTPTIVAASTVQLSATPENNANNVVLVAPGNITWASSSPAVATVNSATGLVTGVTVGSATITATESESHVVGNTIVTIVNANPTPPVLGEAGRFVLLASQTVTTTGTTAISNGDIGVIDQARTFITGFTPTGPAGDYTELTNGTSFASDDANPAPFPNPLHYATPVIGAPWTTTGAMITQVRTDLGIADTFLAANPNPSAPTQVCPIELGTQVLTRGVYRSAADVSITTGALHLDAQGDPNSVFIIVTDGTLTTGASGSIVLDNQAQAKNVYWRSAGKTTIAAGTTFYGNVFAVSQVNVLAGAQITGRLFARTDQVTLIADTVTKP